MFGALGYSIVNTFESTRECKREQERARECKREQESARESKKEQKERKKEREREGEEASDLKGFWAFQQKEKSVISRLQSQGGGAPPSFISIVFNDGD